MEYCVNEKEDTEPLAARAIREIMATPVVKDIVMKLIAEKKGGMEKTLTAAMWTDAGMTLSVVEKIPSGINESIALINELGRQIDSLPEPMLKDFLNDLGSQIDSEQIEQLIDTYSGIFKKYISGISGYDRIAIVLIPRAISLFLDIAEGLVEELEASPEKADRFRRELSSINAGKATGLIFRASKALRSSRSGTMKTACAGFFTAIAAIVVYRIFRRD